MTPKVFSILNSRGLSIDITNRKCDWSSINLFMVTRKKLFKLVVNLLEREL